VAIRQRRNRGAALASDTGPRPSVKHVEELIGLGRSAISAASRSSSTRSQRTPEHAEFVSQMRWLVERFDLDQYMATLKTLHAYDH